MEKNNCTTCLKVTERTTATGHTGWHCTVNDMDVNARMHCDGGEWPQERTTATARPVYAVSVTSISTEKIMRH